MIIIFEVHFCPFLKRNPTPKKCTSDTMKSCSVSLKPKLRTECFWLVVCSGGSHVHVSMRQILAEVLTHHREVSTFFSMFRVHRKISLSEYDWYHGDFSLSQLRLKKKYSTNYLTYMQTRAACTPNLWWIKWFKFHPF